MNLENKGFIGMYYFAKMMSLLVFSFLITFSSAQAAGGVEPPRQKWSFSGPFGTYDRGQLQRGFKIYKEICSSCHSMSLVSFRNLSQPGGPEFSEQQVKVLAAGYQIKDGPNDAGDMFERAGRPSDYFPSPFPNVEAAKAANNGAVPPDFSLIAKARTYERGFPLFLVDIVTQYQEQGVDYIAALLQGYEDPPRGTIVESGLYWNHYFPGNKIGMTNPLVALFDENGKPNDPEFYTDGTVLSREQVARDIASFLMWASEPHMEERKIIGARVMLWLTILSILMFFVKRKIWFRVKNSLV